jgi:hypothetical protein
MRQASANTRLDPAILRETIRLVVAEHPAEPTEVRVEAVTRSLQQRGTIPLLFPFGLADALTSTLDYQSVPTLIRVAGGDMLRRLARRFREVRQ